MPPHLICSTTAATVAPRPPHRLFLLRLLSTHRPSFLDDPLLHPPALQRGPFPSTAVFRSPRRLAAPDLIRGDGPSHSPPSFDGARRRAREHVEASEAGKKEPR
nr:unnamed protein product [Digitaria exilis]